MRKIINLEMPTFCEFGHFQLSTLSEVNFRFEWDVDKKPKLMPDFFSEKKGFNDKFGGTSLYKEVQELLETEVGDKE